MSKHSTFPPFSRPVRSHVRELPLLCIIIRLRTTGLSSVLQESGQLAHPYSVLLRSLCKLT